MRTVLVVVVVMLVADALIYESAYAWAVYRQITWAADQFVALIGDAVDEVNPGRDS